MKRKTKAATALTLSAIVASCGNGEPSAETAAICQGAVDAVGLVVDFSADPTNDAGFTTLQSLEEAAFGYQDRVASFQGAFRRNLNLLEAEPDLSTVPESIRSAYDTTFEAAIDVGLGDADATETATNGMSELLIACADLYDD